MTKPSPTCCLMNPHCDPIKKLLSHFTEGKLYFPEVSHYPRTHQTMIQGKALHTVHAILHCIMQPHYLPMSRPSHQVTYQSSYEKDRPAHRVFSAVSFAITWTWVQILLCDLLLLAMRT